jgi:hypothetical protein
MFMSNVLKSIVGLVVISSAIGFTAAPAHAESKASQCQRFGQAMLTFNQQFSNVKSQRSSNPAASINQLIEASGKGLKQLQSRKFDDPKIRGLQQTALNLYVTFHNDMINVAEAVERRDRNAAIQAYNQMMTAIEPEAKFRQQYGAYCGRAK